MSQAETILVPIDFSDCAIHVVQAAAERASRTHAQVVLLHVLQPPDGLAPGAKISDESGNELSPTDHLRREAERAMPQFLNTVRDLGASVSARFEEGPTASTILEVQKQLRANLILMGTHGRTGLSKLMLGSVADTVKKSAPCPVETIRTVHKKHCKAGSCAWCDTHASPTLRQLRVEQDG